MTRAMRAALAVFAAWGVAAVGPAHAIIPVDCDTTDDFCTGDPCVTTSALLITVPSCVLDFSPRTLVIDKLVKVPNGGALSLTAGSIEVRNVINGRHSNATEGDGADVTLVSTTDILIKRRVDASGRASTGNVLLDAGGSIALEHQVRARVKGRGAVASGGNVTLQADGMVTSTRRGRIDVRGKKNATAAGQVTITAQGDVDLGGRLDVRGGSGGTATVSSATGDVLLRDDIRGQGSDGPGGTVILDAAGSIFLGPSSNRGNILVDGTGVAAGTVAATAVDTFGSSGRIISARGIGVPGGSVSAVATNVDAGKVSVRGSDGGTIDFEATQNCGAVLLDARAHGVGGSVTCTGGADVSVLDAYVDGKTAGGEMRLSAGGNMALGDSAGSRFYADGAVGGVLEGLAGGNLTAIGRFRAATGGCVGLSAGGTLDVSQADIDVTLTGSCP